MQFKENDQIEYSAEGIKHESAGGFVFFEDGRTHKLFVALLRKLDGHWLIPKGHIRKSEEPQDAAVREIKEELTLKETPEIVSFLRTDSYAFTLDESDVTHYKNVHLYVFRLNRRLEINPQIEEGFEVAEWLSFEEAVEKISFDRENLLRARQYFYYNKPVNTYDNLMSIKSLTIAVPTHNGALTISKTLNSVVENLKEIPVSVEKEIVICMDHCTDNTTTVVENFVKEFDTNGIKISFIENQNSKGKADALNNIFSSSFGELFCVIDDDVILEKSCLVNLINTLIEDRNLKCVFSVWKRLPLKSRNPWKLFWHWVLGVKFEIQHDDKFIQYIYWPKTKEMKNSIVYFNSVSSISDYYRRFIRIMVGSKQMSKHFAKDRIDECSRALFRKLDYQMILSLPWRLKCPFLFYRFIRFFINAYVKLKLHFIDDYEWFRFKQN